MPVYRGLPQRPAASQTRAGGPVCEFLAAHRCWFNPGETNRQGRGFIVKQGKSLYRCYSTEEKNMGHADPSRFERVCVVFEKRPDGGLRVSSPDVPGFRLSHSNPALVTADIIPALETIIGEFIGKPVRVSMRSARLALPDQDTTTTATEYETKTAA